MKQFFLTFFLVLSHIGTLQSHDMQTFYSINVKIPHELIELAYLPAYYKGHKLDLHEGWTKLPECGNPCMFSLLITEDIKFKTKGNTISYLERIPEQDYSWYDITLQLCKTQNTLTTETKDNNKKNSHSEQSYTWNIEERSREEAPERIDEKTIVLLTNPDYIQPLVSEKSLPGSLDIALPTIIFKENLDKKEFEETMLSILVGAGLKLNAIHTKDTPTCTLKKENTLITLPKKPYESK